MWLVICYFSRLGMFQNIAMSETYLSVLFLSYQTMWLCLQLFVSTSEVYTALFTFNTLHIPVNRHAIRGNGTHQQIAVDRLRPPQQTCWEPQVAPATCCQHCQWLSCALGLSHQQIAVKNLSVWPSAVAVIYAVRVWGVLQQLLRFQSITSLARLTLRPILLYPADMWSCLPVRRKVLLFLPIAVLLVLVLK